MMVFARGFSPFWSTHLVTMDGDCGLPLRDVWRKPVYQLVRDTDKKNEWSIGVASIYGNSRETICEISFYCQWNESSHLRTFDDVNTQWNMQTLWWICNYYIREMAQLLFPQCDDSIDCDDVTTRKTHWKIIEKRYGKHKTDTLNTAQKQKEYEYFLSTFF